MFSKQIVSFQKKRYSGKNNTTEQQRLSAEAERHAKATVSRSLEQNSVHFNQAREKLEKWADQEKIQKLEKQQRRQRQEIFKAEDEIMEKRDALVESLEKRLSQSTKSYFPQVTASISCG